MSNRKGLPYQDEAVTTLKRYVDAQFEHLTNVVSEQLGEINNQLHALNHHLASLTSLANDAQKQAQIASTAVTELKVDVKRLQSQTSKVLRKMEVIGSVAHMDSDPHHHS
jgi:archaellum component FlaC